MDKTQALTEANEMVEAARAAFLAAAAKATRPDCPVASMRLEDLERAERVRDFVEKAPVVKPKAVARKSKGRLVDELVLFLQNHYGEVFTSSELAEIFGRTPVGISQALSWREYGVSEVKEGYTEKAWTANRIHASVV